VTGLKLSSITAWMMSLFRYASYVIRNSTVSQHLYQIALFVIGVAGSLCLVPTVVISRQRILGFGRQLAWTSDLVVPPGHQMTFQDALHILSSNMIMKLVLPDWTKNLTKKTKRVHLAFIEMGVRDFRSSLSCTCVIHAPHSPQQYMLEMVEARRNADKTEQRYDLFSGLLDAAQDDLDNEAALSDQELLGNSPMSHRFAFSESVLLAIPGNMFIFLIAGHEVSPSPFSCSVAERVAPQTTAHTLCFAFALLALHPDEQERLYQHIKGVMSSLNRTPVRSFGLNSNRTLSPS